MSTTIDTTTAATNGAAPQGVSRFETANHDTPLHVPVNPVRFVTAASLFDGHDASINIMRRILQSQGAEVIHLGHNRSVEDIVRAAVQEDVQGIAISSYQGGHVEYFTYLLDRLREEGLGHVRVYGGGGGVIVPSEIAYLHDYGVARIFSPQDGQRLGLPRMVNTMIAECDVAMSEPAEMEQLLQDRTGLWPGRSRCWSPARRTTRWSRPCATRRAGDRSRCSGSRAPAVPGSPRSPTNCSAGSASTSPTSSRSPSSRGPHRRRGGGALLGDRIRMNAIDTPNVFFRSLATRGTDATSVVTVPPALTEVILAAKAWGPTSWSSRPPASARATRPSCRSSTCRCT
jgi:methylmalonyl-CoA mutase